jgi:hypothetical protein
VLKANGQGDVLAEAYRLRGTLLLRQPTPDAAQAEACFQQALTVARHQQARSWELRAAMGFENYLCKISVRWHWPPKSYRPFCPLLMAAL